MQLNTYREKIIKTLSFEYHLLLIAAADPETQYAGLSLPPGFRSLWGQRTQQKECHESDHELKVNKRKADMLACGGYAPPLLHITSSGILRNGLQWITKRTRTRVFILASSIAQPT